MQMPTERCARAPVQLIIGHNAIFTIEEHYNFRKEKIRELLSFGFLIGVAWEEEIVN